MAGLYGARILVLVPHPDDEVVGCFAAIRRAVAAGSRVHALYLTTGVPAAGLLWPWARGGQAGRVERRRREALAAAASLGLEVVGFRETPTRGLRHELDAVRRQVAKCLDGQGIDTVWTPAFEGAHQDHDAANALASVLGDRAAVFEYATYNFRGGQVRSQEFPARNGTETDIDLTAEEVEAKRAALAAYRSERGNLAHIEVRRESFRPLPVYDYGRPPHPGRLFFARFQWVPIPHPRVDFTPPEEVYATLGAFASLPGTEEGR